MPNALHLEALAPNVGLTANPERGGLNLTMGAPPGADPLVSPVWTVAGWRMQFVRLPGGTSLVLDQAAGRVYVKVILGALAGAPGTPFPGVGEFADTLVTEQQISALHQGALICVFTETEAVDDNVRSMAQLVFQGPMAELLSWQSFEERFGGFTDLFDGQDAHMVYGFHLLDDDGAEIVYLHFWTAGKGVDLSTHNHGNSPSSLAPAFAEVHWVLNNGTGKGGMYRCESPEATSRDRFPMQRGQEHGPFFDFDPATGEPKLRDNGAVSYPWHGWQAGTDDTPDQAYDFVAAFEINPRYVNV